METTIINFGDTEIEKQKFHQHKSPILINDIDINKIVVSKMLQRCLKIYTFIFLPKMSAYRRDFDETKYMSFLIKDDELLEKYSEILKTGRNYIKKKNL